jgi:hypothetical protein
MKVRRVRGMRNLVTIQGLSGRSVPKSREQIVAEQARLEHERARLERELAMWADNQRKTAERLQAVFDRLELLEQATAESSDEADDGAAATPRPKRKRAPRVEQSEDDMAGDWQAIILEY